MIEWKTKEENPGAYDPRFGTVNGADRFRIDCTLVAASAARDEWHAVDLERGGSFRGNYTDCVDWCWRVLDSEAPAGPD